MFVILLAVGLFLEYRTHQASVLIIATIGSFTATILFGLPSRRPKQSEVAEAAARLRREVRRLWEERRARLLGEADGADVRYRRVFSLEAGNVRCSWREGSVQNIHNDYRGIEQRRLLIIGKPGSGKTLAAISLVLDMLTRGEILPPEASMPVPFSVSGWDGEQDLGPWLVDRLVEGFRLSRIMARELVEQDYLLPVLDGLDETGISGDPELPVSRRILNMLRSSPGAFMGVNPRPIIMTCRSGFYNKLPGTERLRNAAVAEIQDLGRRDIESYLRVRFKGDVSRDPFKSTAFAEAISRDDSCLVGALRRPWRLTLAIIALKGGHVHPHMLARFRRESSLSRYLIRAFIPATTEIHPRGRHLRLRGGGARPVTSRQPRHPRKYRPEDVHRWLASLARADGDAQILAHQIRPQDLWLLGGKTATRRLHTAVSVLAGLMVAALAAEVVGGLPGYIVTGVIAVVGVGFGLWAGLVPSPKPRRLSLSQFFTWRGLPRTVLVTGSAALGAWGGLIDGGSGTAITSGIGATLAAATLAGLFGGIVRAVTPQRLLFNDLDR